MSNMLPLRMDQDIFRACRRGDVEFITLLAALGVDINIQDQNKFTTLHHASAAGQAKVVELLIGLGTHTNTPNVWGYMPLHVACENGHLGVVKTLITARADVNAASDDGVTPFWVACQKAHMPILKLLLSSGADIKSTTDGVRALHMACQNGQLEIVKMLLSSGIDPNIPDFMTPLFRASQKGRHAIVQLLLISGAGVNTPVPDGITPLWIACQNGHITVVNILLSSGADINLTRKTDGASALHMACQGGHMEIVQRLLSSGADPNRPRDDGMPPFYLAIMDGHHNIVQLLLKSGADINVACNESVTPLWIACSQGHITAIELLLSLGANINSTRTTDGATVLHMACYGGYLNMVKLLLSSGADPSRLQNDGLPPLYFASLKGYHAIVQLLISFGAEVNARGPDGITSLWIACQGGHITVANILLSSGADVHARGPDSLTPLWIACQKGHVPMAELLLSSGAHVNVPEPGGVTPLWIACQNGHSLMVKLLLSSRADINSTRNTDGSTALYMACDSGHVDIVQMLLSAGADPNRLRDDGIPPLYLASQGGYHDIVQLLLLSGAKINVQCDDGVTPLWISCQKGHLSIVELFLKQEADINSTRAIDGVTALHMACQNGYLEITQRLLSSGADPNRLRNDGLPPLYFASKNGYKDIVQLLLSSGADPNGPRDDCIPPLYLASQGGYHDIVQLLLLSEAEVNMQCDDGVTPLWVACSNGHISVIRSLLSSGADVNLTRADGATALDMACQNGHLDIAHLLLSSGADPNGARPRDNAIPPLVLASLKGYREIVQLLLSFGADTNKPSSIGKLPLHAASSEGHSDIVQLLLSSGADIKLTQIDGATALHIACEHRQLKVVELLLSAGANTNVPFGEHGHSPLFIATEQGHYGIASLLVHSGVDFNQPNTCGLFLLHVACGKGYLEIIKLFCNAGADVNAAMLNSGLTPLHSACSGGHLKVIEFLLSQKALSKSNWGNTTDKIPAFHAYCMSLIRANGHSENDTCLFMKNFTMLLPEYSSICDMSDCLTTGLDMLLLARASTCTLTTSMCTMTDTIIENLGYITAMEGKLNKPLYAILPETLATQGKLQEICSLHTTFSALTCLVNTKGLGVLLKKIRNQCGQKQFLHMCNCLLNKNILHTIAQYMANTDPESVEKAQMFLDLGVDVWAKDINGRLPVHIACMTGNTQLAICYWTAMRRIGPNSMCKYSERNNELIYCRQAYKNKIHGFGEFKSSFEDIWEQNPGICVNRMLDNVGMLPMDYIKLSHFMEETTGELPKSIQEIANAFSIEQTLSQLQCLKFDEVPDKDIGQLLYSSPNGKVQITGENKLIFTSVVQLVQTICDCMGNLDPCFACRPVLSGSVYEGTKTTLLGELDFCLKMLNFEAIAEICTYYNNSNLVASCKPSTTSPQSGMYWRLTPGGLPSFAKNLYCSNFWKLLIKVMTLPIVSQYVARSRITIDDCKRRSGFVGTLFITWYGEKYPCLPISVDLVPVIELGDYYCVLRARYFDHKTIGRETHTGMELSCNKLDKAFMASLSQAQKDAYCLAKVIRGLAKSFISDSGLIVDSDQVIQSYLFKTTLMWIMDPRNQFDQYYPYISKDDMLSDPYVVPISTSSTSHIYEVRMWTVKMFTVLKYMLLQSGRKVHTYNLPLSQHNEVHVRDRYLAIALCDKCIQIARPKFDTIDYNT